MQIKLINTSRSWLLGAFFFLHFVDASGLNDTIINRNSSSTKKQLRDYQAEVKSDQQAQLIPLFNRPGIILDLKYATSGNFTKTVLYPPTPCTFLRKEVYDAFQQALSVLNKEGYGVLIWDAYRPYSVTKKMWDLIQDERYVAHPSKGSGHNRGIAIDMSLFRLADGKPLDMGTEFDHFSEKAHVSYKAFPASILENRSRLQTAMEGAGFKVLETEWWHFYWPNGSHYHLMDLPFDTLLQLYKKSRN